MGESVVQLKRGSKGAGTQNGETANGWTREASKGRDSILKGADGSLIFSEPEACREQSDESESFHRRDEVSRIINLGG